MIDPETFGLNVTNSALGILVLACVLLVFSSVLRELAGRVAKRGPGRRRNRFLAD